MWTDSFFQNGSWDLSHGALPAGIMLDRYGLAYHCSLFGSTLVFSVLSSWGRNIRHVAMTFVWGFFTEAVAEA